MSYFVRACLLVLVFSLSTRASPVMFYQDPQHSKVVYKDDGTIEKIIMPDGRILLGDSGVICTDECWEEAEEEYGNKRKWIIGGLILGGLIFCTALCKSCPPPVAVPPTGILPPVVQPPTPTPIPEPSSLLLIAAGGLFFRLTKRRRSGE